MTAALEGGEWSAARPGRTLPPGKTQYPSYRRLGGPQGRHGRAENVGWATRPTYIRSYIHVYTDKDTYTHTDIHTHVHRHIHTYSMEQSPSCEANRFSPSQEIPRILWNPEVHYRIYKNPPPVPFLSQLELVHVPHPTFWRPISILSSHLRLGLSSGLFPSGSPTKTMYTPFLSPILLHAPPISFFSILLFEQYLVRVQIIKVLFT